MNKKRIQKMTAPAMAEIIFDTAYLIFVITMGAVMLGRAEQTNTALFLYGTLAVILGCGDAFHLLPRIYGHLFGMAGMTKYLGFGKLITSISMTIFYVLLYCVWAVYYGMPVMSPGFFVLIVLAAARIVLCLCPQNGWFHEDAPIKWAIYRNIPFLVIGIILICLFFQTSFAAEDGFRYMPLAIILSFLFYIPVVLFTKKNPKIGALMMPKTAAYIWIVCMGIQLFS